MIRHLLSKPARYQAMVPVDHLLVSPEGIRGNVPSLPFRQVLIVPRSTLERFSLKPGDLRENVVVDDAAVGPLHSLPSGTVLRLGGVEVRLTMHCEPCTRLRGVVGLRAIEHQRGYLGSFLSSGRLSIGDLVVQVGVRHEEVPYDLKERLAWFLADRTLPIEVTSLVREVGLSLSYCRAVPNLLRGRPDLAAKVSYRGRSLGSRSGRAQEKPMASDESDLRARALELMGDAFLVHLIDGRSFTVSFTDLPELEAATEGERAAWLLQDGGRRVYWPLLFATATMETLLGLQGR